MDDADNPTLAPMARTAGLPSCAHRAASRAAVTASILIATTSAEIIVRVAISRLTSITLELDATVLRRRRRATLPPTLGQLPLDVDLRRRPIPGKRGGYRPNAGRPRGNHVCHDRREDFRATHPVHVTLRICREVAVLRRRDAFPILGRRGRVFDDRFHARALRSPRQVRNCILYVLQNERHHAPDRRAWRAFDPHSSAMSFDGWARPLPADAEWQRRALAAPRVTPPPSVWLLTTGWKRRGLIRLDEAPAPGPTR